MRLITGAGHKVRYFIINFIVRYNAAEKCIIRGVTKERSSKAIRRGLMTGLVVATLCAVMAPGCCTGDCARDSGTTYARDDSSGVDAYTNRLN